MPGKYILKDRRPVEIEDTIEWAKEFEKMGDKTVAKTQVSPEVLVSTVFLGLCHRFGLGGPPILFETMVLGGRADGDREMYQTWDEAEAGHEKMVEQVRGLL